MKIIVDAFGGDDAPLEVLKGCEMAVQELGIEILLTGSEAEIRRVAKEHSISLEHMEIADTPDVITMEDSAGDIMKSKANSSMAVGLKKLSAGEGDAFISAGNSGALVVGTTLLVKRIKGVKRVAFAPIMPKDVDAFMLIDCGANVDCKPEMLYQFGVMGSIYMEKVMGYKKPRVALANIGTEDHKGGALQHEAFALLKNSPLNFIGNIEARDIPFNAADVIVSDGFTGNVILKLYEGVAMFFMDRLKGIFKKNAKNKLAAALVMNDFRAFKSAMDYNEYGGAPLIGAAKPVFKAHGSSQAKTFKNALRLTKAYVEGNVVQAIEQSVAEFKEKSDALKETQENA